MKEVHLNLTQTFFIAAREGTYSAAARRLNITYQSVANHIRRLEQQVGEKLVVSERGAKRIQLTPRGTSLFRLLEPEFDVMLARLGSLIDKQRPVLRIGMPHAIFYYLLPPVLAAFRQLHPEVEVVCSERDVSLPELIHNGSLDVCLTERYFGDKVIPQRVLCHYQLALAYPASWAAPADEAKLPQWAQDKPIVTYEPGQFVRNIALDFLEVDRVQPRVVVSTSTSSSVKRCVEEGLGFALLPAWCIDAHDTGLARLPLTRTPRIPIYFGEALFLHKNPFVRSLHKLCAEMLAARVDDPATRVARPRRARSSTR